MKALLSLLLASSALVAAPAFASQELAQKKNCMSCHGVDKKIVGPSFQDVAAKYAADKTAVDKLAQKIQKGGAGVWGPIPMPPNQVSEAEAKTLAQWVMAQKKK